MDVEITELELIDADRVDGVGMPANGIGILMMKQVADPVEKDWAEWDADHGGGGKGGKAGDSKASAADAVARAKQTIADHKAGKKVSAADLKNAHDVHEAHLAHEAKLKAEGKPTTAAAKPAAKPAAKKDIAKGARDCPKCDKSYDADHTGSKCENCGTDLPDAPAAKAEFDREAARELVKAIVGRKVDETPDIAGGTAVLAQIADLIIGEAQELKSGQAGEISDIMQLAMAAEMIWTWRTGEESVASGSVMPATALMQSVQFEGSADEFAAHIKEAVVKHSDLKADPPGDAGGTGKSQIAPEETTVDTVTQTGSLTKAVEEAVAKAAAPLKELIKGLSDELAKVKATPVPTGMVLSHNVQVKTTGGVVNDDLLAKAALYRAKADAATAPSDREGYLALARETEQEARTKSA